jgi:ethanolamine ammonia-lyase large subunit
MLNYQSTSFHDSHYLRQVLGLRPAPEFEAWLEKMKITHAGRRLEIPDARHRLLSGTFA